MNRSMVTHKFKNDFDGRGAKSIQKSVQEIFNFNFLRS